MNNTVQSCRGRGGADNVASRGLLSVWRAQGGTGRGRGRVLSRPPLWAKGQGALPSSPNIDHKGTQTVSSCRRFCLRGGRLAKRVWSWSGLAIVGEAEVRPGKDSLALCWPRGEEPRSLRICTVLPGHRPAFAKRPGFCRVQTPRERDPSETLAGNWSQGGRPHPEVQ